MSPAVKNSLLEVNSAVLTNVPFLIFNNASFSLSIPSDILSVVASPCRVLCTSLSILSFFCSNAPSLNVPSVIFPKVKSPPSPAPTEPGDTGIHLLLLSSQDNRYVSGILEGILVSCNCRKNSTPEEPEVPD